MEHVDWESVTQLMRRYLQEESRVPALPYVSPDELESQLDLCISQRGCDFAQLMEDLGRVVLATPRTGGKRFFNQLFGGRIAAAVAGDMLTPLLNNSMYTYKVAGIQIMVEKTVIAKMCGLVGFDQGEGTFAPGGSLSNLVAMVLARNEKAPGLRDHGFDGSKMTAYASDQCHYSITKNAGLTGLGRRNVRLIPSDSRGKMRLDLLERRIRQDLDEGATPFMIAATAGTTVLGAFDPIAEIVALARKYGMWAHVDAAFGGTALLSPQTRGLLDGCALADSLTWDAHKMMNVPLIASAILVQRRGLLRKNLSETADYLFQGDEQVNPGHHSIQCGRRNDALKVWAAWRYLGDDGYRHRVEKQMALARHAADAVRRDPILELIAEPEFTTVCFQVQGVSSEAICDVLDKRGLAKVAHGNFQGQSFIRLVTVNPDLDPVDIDDFFELVKTVASGLR